MAKKMSSEPIDKDDLDSILKAGVRVPDHGALNPWKLKIIQGKIRKKIDEEIILTEFIKENPKSEKNDQKIEAKRMQRAGAVIAVLSTPKEHANIPEWEMQLSSGAVCMNLLSCAQSKGYAAQWLTEWYAYNDKMLAHLGGRIGVDRISGFIYIGQKIDEPIERKRPNLNDVVDYL
jgi:nitroreductase